MAAISNDERSTMAAGKLTQGSVSGHLVSLTWPMAVALLSVMAFNLADAFFVAQLGTQPLAALSLTFPVVFTLFSLGLGLSIGTSSVIARAIGVSERTRVQRLTTDTLLMSLLVALGLTVAGLTTIGPLFRLLGASHALLPLINDYMVIWYLGLPLLVVPMIGNSAIRAAGNTRFPAALMLAGAIINAALDPVLIFGLGPLPGQGIAGAAYASVLARAITTAPFIYALHHRERLVALSLPSVPAWIASCRQVLHVALPAAATNVIDPIAYGAITALVAGFGPATVAGFGVAARIESLALIPMLALTAAMGPLIGQNWAANQPQRIAETVRLSFRFCLGWGLLCAALLAAVAPVVVAWFDPDPSVVASATAYLRIVPVSFAAFGVIIVANAGFNAVGQPLTATTLKLARTAALYVPLAYAGNALVGLHGIFAAATLASFSIAPVAWRATRRLSDGAVERRLRPSA